MAEVGYNRADGIVLLDTANDFVTDVPVSHLLVTGDTAGTFVVKIGNTSVNIYGAANVSLVVPVNRQTKVEVTSVPTNGEVYVFLKEGH